MVFSRYVDHLPTQDLEQSFRLNSCLTLVARSVELRPPTEINRTKLLKLGHNHPARPDMLHLLLYAPPRVPRPSKLHEGQWTRPFVSRYTRTERPSCQQSPDVLSLLDAESIILANQSPRISPVNLGVCLVPIMPSRLLTNEERQPRGKKRQLYQDLSWSHEKAILFDPL